MTTQCPRRLTTDSRLIDAACDACCCCSDDTDNHRQPQTTTTARFETARQQKQTASDSPPTEPPCCLSLSAFWSIVSWLFAPLLLLAALAGDTAAMNQPRQRRRTRQAHAATARNPTRRRATQPPRAIQPPRNRATINPTNQPVRCRSSRLFVCVVVVRFFRVAPPRARTPHFSARAFIPLATASLSHLLVSTSFCARARDSRSSTKRERTAQHDRHAASESLTRPTGAARRTFASACGGATVVGGASCLWRRPLALLEALRRRRSFWSLRRLRRLWRRRRRCRTGGHWIAVACRRCERRRRRLDSARRALQTLRRRSATQMKPNLKHNKHNQR